MPEIAEVARIVHFLRLHLVGKRIAKASAPDDPIVFGKVGTTGPQIESAANGKKVVAAGSQGKYFWIAFDKPPHLVMHFGMTGWIHIKDEKTAYTNYYKKQKPEDEDLWPPRFWKFQLETDSKPPVKVAFTDARRLGRVRVVDCPGAEIRKHSPLVENGPDPVVDVDIFTEDFLRRKVKSRKVPIKALLLDQKAISGIGNWVADEVLFQARLHPELYCDQFSDGQIKKLYESIRYVCQTAVDKLGDSDQFPKDWLFNHRWGKGKLNSAGTLPTGEKLAFLTVGGRTSCFAPALQKKTGKVAGDADVKAEGEEEEEGEDAAQKPARKVGKKKIKAEDGEADGAPTVKAKGRSNGRAKATVKDEDDEEEKVKPDMSAKKTQKRKGDVLAAKDSDDAPPSALKKQRRSSATAQKSVTQQVEAQIEDSGRRRSGRVRSRPAN
ncbi:related to formamidopyrimidine-DNA glycosylase [Cephalotrichum gorgonifer]|uniref:Related to formamidopyrimidine-DNA glycosylase n=1 Tax=Cephalotrichum gorgonifer TaxID=2041049 RepID=A0AAE8SXI6_9PEZI|nr:related to formamidopyrimidine-DNA glycosylase [Cephalotrichum gorgonifer]